MKRNFIITLLLTFTMLFVTACGSDNNNKNNYANSKFEGTWIAYDKNKGVSELKVESLNKQAIVSLTNYNYKALMDSSSSGIFDAQMLRKTGETATVHAD